MISPETIALVRDRADIVAVISEVVPSLKKRGRTYTGLCPFHKEKTPSFHVNQDRGFFHCFGCKESGSVVDFVMKQEGATFPEAVRSLAERVGIVIEEDKRERSEVDRQKKARDDLYAVNQLAATFFEEQLRQHSDAHYAHEELEKRGLRAGHDPKIDDTLQAFRIGYAPASWDGLTTFLRAQGASVVAAESVGLLVPRSSGTGHYDRFRHRLMFAVMDVQGRVVAFSGRALRDHPSEKKSEGPTPKYINSPESPIYTKGQNLFGLYQARHEIRADGNAVLVEGNFDVVSLHARGLGTAVAPLGTAFTVEQAKLLKRFASHVTFLFDADAAGAKAVRLSREPAREAGLSTRVAQLPEGLDPDEFSRSRGIDALYDVLKAGRGMGEFLIETELDATFGSADAYEKKERVARVVKILQEEDDPLVRSMLKSFTDRIAGRLDLVRSPEAFRALEQTVDKAFREAKARGVPPVSPKDARIKVRPAGSLERREICAALIEYPSLLDREEVQAFLPLLEGPGALLVAALAEARFPAPEAEQKTLDTHLFLSQIPKELQTFAAEHLASPKFLTESEATEHLLDNANKLKRLLLSQEASELARENYRAQGDWETETELTREALERVRAKHGLKQ